MISGTAKGAEDSSTPGSARSRFLEWIALAVLALGVVSRLLFLGSDPVSGSWVGYVTDEGRWTHQARELALFGSLDLSDSINSVHLLVAPLYQATTFVPFALFGVGFVSARLVSAAAGIVLLLSVFAFARRRLTSEGLLLTVIVVALAPDLWLLSRVAIPEMALLVFEFLAFAILMAPPRSALRSFLAGLVLAVGLGFKGTGLPVVAVFAAVIVVAHQSGDPATRSRRVAAFLAAVAASAVVALVGVVSLTDFVTLSRLGEYWSLFTPMVQPASPYSAASVLLYDASLRLVRLAAFGAWILAGVLLLVGRMPRGKATALYLGSATWAAAWLGLSLGISYFPERYVYHGLVPLALNLGAGLTLLQELGAGAVMDAVSSLGRGRRRVVALWLALPMAVLLAPLFVALAGVVGLTLERLSHHLLLVAVLDVALAVLAVRLCRFPAVVLGLIVGPLLVAPLQYVLGRGVLVEQAFWSPAGLGWPVAWFLLLGGTAVVIGPVLARLRERPGAARRWGYAYLAAVGLTGLSGIAPALLSPSFTIRDAALGLEELLGDRDVVWQYRAAGVFLGNDVRYREVTGRGDTPDDDIDVIVGMYRPIAATAGPTFQVVREYTLNLGVTQDFLTRRGIDANLRVFRRATESEPR